MTRGTRGERGAKLGRTLKKGLLYTLFELKDKTNPCDKVRIYTNGQK